MSSRSACQRASFFDAIPVANMPLFSRPERLDIMKTDGSRSIAVQWRSDRCCLQAAGTLPRFGKGGVCRWRESCKATTRRSTAARWCELAGFSGRHGLQVQHPGLSGFRRCHRHLQGRRGGDHAGPGHRARRPWQPGMPVVEASSGSFGAALAVSAAPPPGHPCILVVPRCPASWRGASACRGWAREIVVSSSRAGRRALVDRMAAETASPLRRVLSPTTLPTTTTPSTTAG